MRIITGSARGTKLESPAGETTRPTSDRVKEAVFSMLQFDIEGSAVLDLFAGSGQMGLEALSRGAEKATFVDISREAVDAITAYARKTHLIAKCRIISTGFSPFLRGEAGREKYDLIFLDPPYDSKLLPKALRSIADAGLCSSWTTLVCETDCDIPPKATRLRKDEDAAAEYIFCDVFGEDEELRKKYRTLKSTLYGRTRITLLQPQPEGEDAEADE